MIGLEGIRWRCNGQDVDVIGNNYIIVSLPSFHLQTCLFMLKSLNATNLCRKKATLDQTGCFEVSFDVPLTPEIIKGNLVSKIITFCEPLFIGPFFR